jgi:hypothetical protein
MRGGLMRVVRGKVKLLAELIYEIGGWNGAAVVEVSCVWVNLRTGLKMNQVKIVKNNFQQ